MFGERIDHSFGCKACGGHYTRSCVRNGFTQAPPAVQDMPITRGPSWCYRGPHTVKPLPDWDQRRICNDVVTLSSSPDLQNKIDALDGNENVRVLKICSTGLFDDDTKPKLAIRLPNLEEVQFLDIEMVQIKLTPELTPKVRKVWMQNPTQEDEPDFTILLPELRDFSCYYWGPGNYEWVVNMLQAATKLERFDSYKLRVGYLRFASNHLQSIRLHRAELHQRIELWAPRLTNLDVQAAYDLEEIEFLRDHPLKRELPDNFCFREELVVNAMNACLGQQAIAALRAHPRVHQEIEMDDPDFMWQRTGLAHQVHHFSRPSYEYNLGILIKKLN